MKKLFLLLPIVIFLACTKFRDVPGKYVSDPTNLRINEFMCKGSDPASVAYLGGNAKWFELYNPTNADIVLTAGKWFITDTLGVPNKFPIPTNTSGAQWKVPAKGYLVIMCVKAGSTTGGAGRINANFSLSSTVGEIGIFYQENATSPYVKVDGISYNYGSGSLSGVSYGRKPDGQDPATLQLSKVTPEASNN